jgi:hypothetical protein
MLTEKEEKELDELRSLILRKGNYTTGEEMRRLNCLTDRQYLKTCNNFKCEACYGFTGLLTAGEAAELQRLLAFQKRTDRYLSQIEFERIEELRKKQYADACKNPHCNGDCKSSYCTNA